MKGFYDKGYWKEGVSMTCSQTLAEYIVGLEFGGLPEKTVLKVKHSFADWFAAVFASRSAALSDKYVAFAVAMGGDGSASIIGREERPSFSWAAFANGCLGHIEEVDDGRRMSIMHIGTVEENCSFRRTNRRVR